MEDKEKRKKKAKEALTISKSCNQIPSESTIEKTKEYIKGKITIEELQKQVIDMYKN